MTFISRRKQEQRSYIRLKGGRRVTARLLFCREWQDAIRQITQLLLIRLLLIGWFKCSFLQEMKL